MLHIPEEKKEGYGQIGGKNYYRNIEFIKSELSLINNFMMYTLSKCIDTSLELNITTNNIYKLLKQYISSRIIKIIKTKGEKEIMLNKNKITHRYMNRHSAIF